MELSNRNTLESDDGVPLEPQRSRAQYALPPTDQGFYAWVALGGAFLSNALIWGFALSFGILQEYYASHEPFASQGGIASIGTTSTGIMYLTMPLFLWGFQKWPKARRYSLWVSVPIIAISLVGASFANTVSQLIVCQGIIYGIAGNALVMPTINLINEWFLQKRGLAIGIAISGDFAGGVVMPLILQAVLNEVGFRWVSTIIMFAALIPCLSFADQHTLDTPYRRLDHCDPGIAHSFPHETPPADLIHSHLSARGSRLLEIAVLLDVAVLQHHPGSGLLPPNQLPSHHRRESRSRKNAGVTDHPLCEPRWNLRLHWRRRSRRPLRCDSSTTRSRSLLLHSRLRYPRLHNDHRAAVRLQSRIRPHSSCVLHELGRRHSRTPAKTREYRCECRLRLARDGARRGVRHLGPVE